MKPLRTGLVAVMALLDVFCMSAHAQPGTPADADVEEYIAKGIGGSIGRHENKPGQPIRRVHLYANASAHPDYHGLISEKSLRDVIPILVGLTDLEELHLGVVKVSKKGLASLAVLKQLKRLELALTNFTDDRLEELASLKNLRQLRFFDSEITDKGLKKIAGLKHLERLDLYDARITDAGLKHLAGMKLQALTIPSCAQTSLGLKHYLAALQQPITHLQLDDWAITDQDLKLVGSLKALQHLNLHSTNVGDAGVRELSGLEKLKYLDLEDTLITDGGLCCLDGLKLETLKLPIAARTDFGLKHYARLVVKGPSGNPHWEFRACEWNLTDAGFKELQALKHLQSLDLGGSAITDAGLKGMLPPPNVTSLNVSGTKISDAGLATLPDWKHLKRLFLAQTKVTDAGLKYLRKCQALKNLNLIETAVTDAGLAALDSMKLETLHAPEQAKTDLGLKHYLSAVEPQMGLQLSGWTVGDAAAPVLAEQKQLMSLCLANTRVSDKSLSWLKVLKHLKELDLRETAVTAAGLEQLKGMKLNSLECPTRAQTDTGLKHYLAALNSPLHLDLSGWELTDAGVPALLAAPELRTLQLNDTLITDRSIPELMTLNQLIYLNITGTRISAQGAGLLRMALPKCKITCTGMTTE